MAYNPGVSFFIPFHELDPSKQKQCIFFTQKGVRCRWRCKENDNSRAVALHRTILASSSEVVSLDLLQEYVLCNCCRSGIAQHRDRIEDIDLLIPLARRWQDEIRRHAADQSVYTASIPTFEESIFIRYAYTTPTTPTLGHTTTLYTPATSPSYCQPNNQTSFSINTPLSKPAVGSPSHQYRFPTSSVTTEFTSQPFKGQPRYDLRSHKSNIPTGLTSTHLPSISQRSLSEFRLHITDPRPSDSVSWKIRDPLGGRDFKTGSLYIFDRASSPGHVKIGWTANSVSRRLEDWSKCGYHPNLLFSIGGIPHAQRVETLTHYELVKEWRRERVCKAPWCRKSHQEWFEISKERAEQVLCDWAYFITRAEPYDSQGCLKDLWKKWIEMMDGNGELVTAKKLLELHDASLVEGTTLVEKMVDPGHASKIEVSIDCGSKVGCLVAVKAGAERLIKTEPPARTRSLSSAEPLSKATLPFKAESLSQTELLPKSEQVHKSEGVNFFAINGNI